MRRLSANYVFDGTSFFKNAIIVVDNTNIVVDFIDTRGNLRESEGVEFYSGILCPGFVNAHCHIELSHLHNKIEQNVGLQNFVKAVVAHRAVEFDIIEDAIKKADFFMKKEGIIAVGDIANTTHSNMVKQHSAIAYHTFFEVFDLFNTEYTHTAFQTISNNFKTLEHSASIVPHASYSCSPQLFQLLFQNHDAKNRCISIHNQETISEDEMFLKGSGILFDFFARKNEGYKNFKPTEKSACKSIVDMLPRGNRYMFVHNTFTKPDDIAYAHQQLGSDECFWCLCPRSNSFIERSQPNYTMFEENGATVVFGTDSLASNTSLSILEELKLATQQQSQISLAYLLQCATLNGAKALKMDATIGSFGIGKKPGVVLLEKVDLQNMQLTPRSSVKVFV